MDLDMMANCSHGPSHGNEYTVNFDDAVRQIQVNGNKLTKASLLCCASNMSEVGIGTRLRDGVKQDLCHTLGMSGHDQLRPRAYS
jgi:hypothetical protein